MIEVRREIDPLYGEWDELADRVGAPAFLRPGWMRAWWEAFGRGALEILVLRREGRLAGLLPLYRERAVLRSPSNGHTPLFEPLVEDESAADELAGAMLAGPGRRIGIFYLTLGESGYGALRRAAGPTGHRVVQTTLEHSPYVPIESDWDSFTASLETKLMREIRRRRRRLESEGQLSLDVSHGTDRFEALLEEGFRIEAGGWKSTVGTAIAARPETRRFYTELARWAADRGILRLGFLRLDGRALAFDFSIEEAGVHYLLKTGYDIEHAKLGPGIMMRHDMIERAFREGLTSYEFLGQSDAWKLRWTQSTRERVALRAFSPSVCGQVNWVSVTQVRPFAKRLLRRA